MSTPAGPVVPVRRRIGQRLGLGISDGTLLSPLNPYLPGSGWDVVYDPQAIGSALTEIEVYHVALDGPVGSSAIVLLDGNEWDYVAQAWSNGWDPSQPMLLGQTSTLVICWNVAATSPPYDRINNIQARATLWLRHEPPPQRPGDRHPVWIP
jgi:hypothetical protein